MKYKILIDQKMAMDHSLDLIDAAIFEVISSMFSYGNMKRKEAMGTVWTWISYSLLISELPCANIKSKRGIRDRIEKLKKAKLLRVWIDADNGSRTYFSQGELFNSFFTDTQEVQKSLPDAGNTPKIEVGGVEPNFQGGGTKLPGGVEVGFQGGWNQTSTNPNTNNQIQVSVIQKPKKLPIHLAIAKETYDTANDGDISISKAHAITLGKYWTQYGEDKYRQVITAWANSKTKEGTPHPIGYLCKDADQYWQMARSAKPKGEVKAHKYTDSEILGRFRLMPDERPDWKREYWDKHKELFTKHGIKRPVGEYVPTEVPRRKE